MSDIFEAAKSVSLQKVYEDYTGVTLNKKKVSSLSCPICGHNGCFSFFTNNKTGELNFHCFSCGEKGDVIAFVKSLKSLPSMLDSAKDICITYGIEYDDTYQETIDPDYQLYLDCVNYSAGLFNILYFSKFNPNPGYFESRGLSKEIIKEYMLGYVPATGKLTNKEGLPINFGKDVLLPKFSLDTINSAKIVNSYGDCIFNDRYTFPIFNKSGKPIAFAGRSLNTGVAKYINTAETAYFKKASVLYNYHKACKYSTVYVVEGYMDALSLIQAGIPNVVAAMGTAFGDAHLELKIKHPYTLQLHKQ